MGRGTGSVPGAAHGAGAEQGVQPEAFAQPPPAGWISPGIWPTARPG